ncbi:MAG TPA: hypothetical protein VLG93_08545 [Sulfuricaulis sp.]|nr:hypothetical protein [Sulfuricaulis sp.]
MTDDLFSGMGLDADMDEAREERAAIIEHDAKTAREQAEAIARADTERHRHAYEVRSVMRMYQNEGTEAVAAFLVAVGKHRGAPAAEKIRQDVWAQIKAAEKSQRDVLDKISRM